MPSEGMFRHPTSVLLCGDNRSLLNWVAYAFASTENPEFIWTDARLSDQVLDDDDPLARHMVPQDRLHFLYTNEVLRDDSVLTLGLEGVIRADEPPSNVRHLIEFLRLPPRLQEMLSVAQREGRPATLVLSNGHRMASRFPAETVAPFLQAVIGAGAILLMTFADAPGEARQAFETVLLLDGENPKQWRQATLTAEKGPSDGPFRTGAKHRLDDLEPVASVLARALK